MSRIDNNRGSLGSNCLRVRSIKLRLGTNRGRLGNIKGILGSNKGKLDRGLFGFDSDTPLY